MAHSLVVTPAPSRRVFRAAWIMARAYTPNLAVALLALPWCLVAVIPAALRRGLFLDRTGTGMVILYRSALLLDILIVLPLMFRRCSPLSLWSGYSHSSCPCGRWPSWCWA